MKRRDLIAKLENAGCRLPRHGSRHAIHQNPSNGKSEHVAQHNEINELLSKKILKSLVP